MSEAYLTPDEINARPGGPFYSCRRCHATTGLHWYRGTSCPVCSDPACTAFCDREWDAEMSQQSGGGPQ